VRINLPSLTDAVERDAVSERSEAQLARIETKVANLRPRV
jgi:hypothetical protein